jgi:hypothetical protein
MDSVDIVKRLTTRWTKDNIMSDTDFTDSQDLSTYTGDHGPRLNRIGIFDLPVGFHWCRQLEADSNHKLRPKGKLQPSVN